MTSLFAIKNPHRYLQFHEHCRNRDFVRAFSYLPQNEWTTTSKRRWICARLGLYQQLLQVGLSGQHKFSLRSTISYIEALSAYGQLEECQKLIDKWIKHPFFYRFKNELIVDFAKYNPQLAIQIINSISQDKQSSTQKALRLSLRQQLGLLDGYDNGYANNNANNYANNNDQSELTMLIESTLNKNPDLLLLKNNIAKDLSRNKKLMLLNEYQAYFNLPNYQFIDSPIDSLIDLKDAFDSRHLAIKNSLPHHPLSMTDDNHSKVTILVTMYNSENYIQSTLHSLLNQTWHNIEVIVVDDFSTDNCVQLAKIIVQQDSRLKVICQTENTGTFIAKSLGLTHATGDFVLCHDSDDWAHPLKIEQQVLPFFYDKTLKATTSDWIKLADDGNYFVRQGYPLKRKNPASLMFRRLETLEKLADNPSNLWEQVRTGADSEFFERFKLYFGKNSIQHIAKPLTIGGHRRDSLMNDKATGTQNLDARIQRLQYWEDWRIRHIKLVNHHKVR